MTNEAVPAVPNGGPGSSLLSVQLSKKLFDRLSHTAKDEGVSLEALVQELLAEGVTLRAWEIVERKSAMRGESGGGRPNFNQGNHGGHHGHHQGGRGRQGNAWMEDKAAFLEYVRNQEKRRR